MPDAQTETILGADLDTLVGYNLKRVYMIFQADFRETLGQDGLSPRAFSVLALSVRHSGMTQSELARRLGIERSGLVAIVDQLERAGYIQRVEVPGDRRVQALTPTRQGRDMFVAASDNVLKHEERVLSVLTDDERRALSRLLARLRKAHEPAA